MATDPAAAGAAPRPALRLGLALFQLGLVLAVAHVTVALEIGATLSRHGALVKSLVLLLYPVAVACLGLGAALDRLVLRSDDPRWPQRGAAACLLLFLPVTLRLNFLSGAEGDQAVASVAHVLSLGGWFLFAGVAIARMLRAARRSGARAVGLVWAAHQLGLVLGYLVQDPLLPAVGANALHAVIAASLLLPPAAGLAAAAGALGLAARSGLDAELEALRDTSAVFDADYGENQSELLLDRVRASGEDTLRFRHQAWSRLGLFQLVEVTPGSDHFAGWYNFQPQWDLNKPEDQDLAGFRDALYAQLPAEGRLAILGVGGGRGLLSLPHPHDGVWAIEREPAVVHYFTEIAPADNHQIFNRVRTVASDGRQFLERAGEPFDAIIFESARYQPATSLLPASAPFHLYTREALAAAVARLAPDAFFIAGFTSVRPTASLEYLPLQVAASLAELGLAVETVSTERHSHVHVIAAREPDVVARVLAAPGMEWVPWTGETQADPMHRQRLTDATPFAAWTTMKGGGRTKLLAVAGLLGLVCVAAAAAALRRGGRAGRRVVPYFFSIGVAQAVIAVATCTLWRSYYDDDVLTVIRVLAWLIAFGALGSAASGRLRPERLPRPARVAVVLAGMGLHLGLCALVPFGEPSALLRELAAPLLLAPGGLLMGVFFPLGIGSDSEEQVGRALLADALGALAGYVLLFAVALPFGLPAFAATGVLAYGLAAASWTPARGGA